MNVFISHACEQKEVAEEVALALREEHHQVFLDSSELPEGDAYNAKIREAVQGCDLFVFLLSPESVSEGRYTLTELGFAETKWPSPVGHILPVAVRPTGKPSIPAYLRAVVILHPTGNVAAEVVAAVDRLSKPRSIQFIRRYSALFVVLFVVAVGVGSWRAYERWHSCGNASRIVREANLQQDAKNYSFAWDRYAEATAVCPGNNEIEAGQERLAMKWLDNIRVTEGKETFADIVNKVLPTLSKGAMASENRRAANSLAHLGWADFLRSREGAGGLNPVHYYEQAVARDPQNPFAHAMWAHNILWEGGRIDAVKTHFRNALGSGLERLYVREMELASFQLHHDSNSENELIRVLDEMRVQGEELPPGTKHDSPRWRIWNVYYGSLINGYERESFLRAISPDDHVATFRWVFPVEVVPESKRSLHQFILAQLQENQGDRVSALASYESLLKRLVEEKWEGPMVAKSQDAIRRLRGE